MLGKATIVSPAKPGLKAPWPIGFLLNAGKPNDLSQVIGSDEKGDVFDER